MEKKEDFLLTVCLMLAGFVTGCLKEATFMPMKQIEPPAESIQIDRI